MISFKVQGFHVAFMEIKPQLYQSDIPANSFFQEKHMKRIS